MVSEVVRDGRQQRSGVYSGVMNMIKLENEASHLANAVSCRESCSNCAPVRRLSNGSYIYINIEIVERFACSATVYVVVN